MSQFKITILAIDFKPNLGGVAEYTSQLAQGLHKLGLLSRVISPVPQTIEYPFAVEAPNEYKLNGFLKKTSFPFNKIPSLFYLLQLRWIEFLHLHSWFERRSQVLFIINWIVSPLAVKWINIAQKNQTPYALILYGKDIIVSTREQNFFFVQACQKAEILIFCSRKTQALFEKLHPTVETRKYSLLPGIDLTYLQKFEEVPSDIIFKKSGIALNQKMVVSSVARLVKRKGIDLAIQAIDPILKSNPNLVYIIAGDGEEYSSLKSLVKSLDLEKQVKLIGRCTDQEKFSLLKTSSIFLMPNHQLDGDDFEGFGISFIEASYFRNVVIGGRSGGAIEAIKEGITGFLVDTDADQSTASLREQLKAIVQDPAQIKTISESGRKYVCENFIALELVQEFVQTL